MVEWLDQFDVYACQTGVNDTLRAVVLLDHLGGGVRERKCCATPQRDYDALVALFKLRFAPHETVHSLSAEFYARVQLDGETLAEYNRVRNHMEIGIA